jgi:hypothetical protein
MGRHHSGLPQNCEPRTVELFKVRLDSGGYDNGGAYWGTGAPLYCATDNGGYCQFVRANSRAAAMVALELEPGQLKRRPADRRYTLTREHTGAARPQWVARFCGEFLAACPTPQQARQATYDHQENRSI